MNSLELNTVDNVVEHYKNIAMVQLHQQEDALRASILRDTISTISNLNKNNIPKPRLSFRHSEIFKTAILFNQLVNKIIGEVQ
jgi:hypothetical protein